MLRKDVVDSWWGERDKVCLSSLFVLSLGWDSEAESKWEENSAFLEKVGLPRGCRHVGGIYNLKSAQ